MTSRNLNEASWIPLLTRPTYILRNESKTFSRPVRCSVNFAPSSDAHRHTRAYSGIRKNNCHRHVALSNGREATRYHRMIRLRVASQKGRKADYSRYQVLHIILHHVFPTDNGSVFGDMDLD